MNAQGVSQPPQERRGKPNGILQEINQPEPENHEESDIRNIVNEESVGSDTDNSKVDATDTGSKDFGDGRDVIRPNALKKSATFKPVSVTKNFLAKAATTLSPVLKGSGDKGMFHLLNGEHFELEINLCSEWCRCHDWTYHSIRASPAVSCKVCKRSSQCGAQSVEHV